MKTTNENTKFNHNQNPTRLALLAALMLIVFAAAVIPAAAQEAENQPSPRLMMRSAQTAEAVPADVSANGVSSALAAAYCLYNFNGTGVLLRCNWSKITANSHVVLAISEYGTGGPTDRFIGAAPMTIHNIAPFAGGVTAEVDINWGSPLNIRLDVLTD
jgi:hypothetical protein